MAGAILAGVLVLGLGGPASAHSELERSEPPDGGQIDVDRTRLTLWFSEPVDPASARFELQSDTGTRAGVHVDITNDATGAFIEIKTSELWQDTFILEWDLLSTIDGHSFPGSIVFGAGVRPVTTASGGVALPDTSSLALRWLDLTALMLLIGGVAVSSRVLAPQARLLPAELGRVHRLTDLAALAALVTGLVTIVDRVPRYDRALGVWFDSIVFSTLADTTWGRLWATRQIALAVLVVALVANRRARNRSGRAPIEVQLALAVVVVTEAWAGHAGAVAYETGVAVAAAGAHLLAAGVWVGGLCTLTLVFAPWWDRRRGQRRRAWSPTAVWARFSPLALGSLLVLVATGLYSSGRHLPGLGAVGPSIWGLGLSVKLALALGAVVLAGANGARVHPDRASAVVAQLGSRLQAMVPPSDRPGPPGLNPVRAEAGLLLLAVVVAAVMVSVSTPREVAIAESIRSAPKSATVNQLFTTLEVVPAGEAQDRIIVRTNSLRRPEPGPITSVDLVVEGPGGRFDIVEALEIEAGRYEVEVGRLVHGRWDVEITVHRAGLPDTVAPFFWDVEDVDLDHPVALERALSALAAALLAGALVLRIGRRSDPGPAPTPDPPRSPATPSTENRPELEVQC